MARKKNKKAAEIVEQKAEEVAIKDDEDFFCDDLKLSNEQLLEIKCSHLEREIMGKDVKILFSEIQLLERQRELMNLRMSDLKAKSVKKDRDHKEVIESIGRKVGVSLLDSQINFETGRVTFS